MGDTGILPIPRGALELQFRHKNLGILTSLRIGHDNSGMAPRCQLEHVLVRNEVTGESCLFDLCLLEQWTLLYTNLFFAFLFVRDKIENFAADYNSTPGGVVVAVAAVTVPPIWGANEKWDNFLTL